MEKILTKQELAERSLITTYRARIWKKFVAAINQYQLIEDGDRIAVCLSGGKDSFVMAKCFQELAKHGRHNFSCIFLVMDPGYAPANRQKIMENAEILGIPIEVFETNIFETVKEVDRSPCYLCARMRRGYLYSEAQKRGCNKIALGHHFNDVVETILMGLLYNGQVQSMMPKLHSENFAGMQLIRPLYQVEESAIIAWKNLNGLDFLQCACRFTEHSQADGNGAHASKRQEMKELVKYLEKQNKQAAQSIFKSMENVNLDTVIGWKTNGKRFSFFDGYNSNN